MCIRDSIYRDPDDKKFIPFVGSVQSNSDEIALSYLTESTFIDRFGDCYWRDQDDKESILFYEFPNREWQVEFDTQSLLKRIIVTSNPLMARKDQREAYGVTRPWPPNGT